MYTPFPTHTHTHTYPTLTLFYAYVYIAMAGQQAHCIWPGDTGHGGVPEDQ